MSSVQPTKNHHKFDWLRAPLLAVLFPALFLLLFQIIKGNRPVVNFIVRRITSPLKHGISWLCSFLPFGVAEVVWAAAIFGLSGFVVRALYLIITKPQRGKRVIRRGLAAVSIALCIYSAYTIGWGINYYADNLCQQTALEDRPVSAEELHTLMVAFADRASELAPQVTRDEHGEYVADLDAIFARSVSVYDGLVEEFPCLEGPARQPKPMFFSYIMSHLNFTGFYFPFTAESMVNVHQCDYLIPYTILHEISHQRNIAPEDECNFLGILAGVQSDDIDFAYSCLMGGYIQLGNALWKADRDLWRDAANHLSDLAAVDNEANRAYWKQFETPVKTVGETTYHNFMKSFDQKDGLATYGKCVDLLVSYYFDVHPEARFW